MPRRIIFPHKGQVALQDFTLPDLGPRDLKICTLYSLMSIGTETIILHQKYAPDTHFARRFSFPQLKTGVKAVGDVEQHDPFERGGQQCLTSDVMTKGLTIQATHDSHDRDGWTQRRIDNHFFACVEDGRFDLTGLITHEFAPEAYEAAYTLAERQREQVMGILFDWT